LDDNEAAGFNIAGLIFNAGASAFTVNDANAFSHNLTGNITNNSTSLQTINDVFALTATRTVTLTNGGGDVTLGGSISGTGFGLTTGGTGTLTLGGANSYTGTTTYGSNNTRLALTNAAALGNNTTGSSITFGATTGTTLEIDVDGGISKTNLTLGSNTGFNTTIILNRATAGAAYNQTFGTANLGGGTVNVQGGGNVTSGTQSLTLSGVTLSSGSTQTTTFNPTTATVSIGTVSGLTNNQAHTLGLGGTSAGNTVTGIISNGTGTTSVVKSNTSTWTLSAANSFTGGLTVAGGTLALTGANTFTGGITAQGGTLNIGNGTAGSVASNALTFSGASVVNFNEAAGSTQTMGTLTFSAGAGNLQSTYGGSGTTTLTFGSLAARTAGATGNFISSGGTNGTSNLIKFTTAPTTGALLDKGLFFNGNSYAAYDAGGFVRAYGAADANYATAAGVNGIASVSTNNTALTADVTAQNTATVNTLNLGQYSVTLNSGQTLQTNGLLSSGNAAATLSGGTTLQAATSGGELVVRVDQATDQLTVSMPVTNNTNASALTKSGAGTLTLSAANTYTGVTSVAQGTLSLTGTSTGAGGLTVTGGSFNAASSGTTNALGALLLSGTGNVSISSGTYSATTNTGTMANTSTLQVSGGTLNISGGGNFFPIGTTVGQVATATIAGGTVNVVNTFGAEVGQTGSGVLTINSGTFSVNASGAGGSAFGTTTGNGLQIAATAGQTGVVNLNGGTLAVSQFQVGSAGAGTFLFNGGTLQALRGNNAFFWQNQTVLSAQVRNGGGTVDNNTFNITIAQPLVHSTQLGDNATDGGMIFKGSGTTTLSGANTYNGGTTLSTGQLTLATTGTLGGGNVTLADTTGVILQLLNNAAIADTATLTFGTNSAIQMNAASGSDTLAAIFDSTTSKTLNTAGVYTFTDLNNYFGGTSFSSLNGETFTIAPVPEPATWMAGALLVGAVGYSQRRRFRGGRPAGTVNA
ncbi:MAG: S-layer family protein, partial [Rhodospirillales bacterium]|nr:S-layer family protein [Acetobacter sp.]